jgi:KamA family protein
LLSGGDPLVLDDDLLADLTQGIESIPHVRRLRIHTRLPIVVPERVTARLIDVLTLTRLHTVVVVHANHANELNHEVADALQRLKASGTLLLNQAVLLRGVNDSVMTQRALCERLIELGVLPYYLHQLDRVAGAQHFEVPVAEGLEIIRELRSQLPGYMVPRYVQEIAGEPNKRVLA